MKDITTEEKILQAAERVFMRDGYDGSRMQEIANEAGINKALLHYYFRSKDKLFEKIFNEKFITFFPKLGGVLDLELSFTDKVCLFIERYLEVLRNNPYVPYFIITNIHKKNNSDILQNFPKDFTVGFEKAYEHDLKAGKVKKIISKQLQISVMSMCIFPFLGKPIIKEVFNLSEPEFCRLIEERTKELQQYVRLILAP